LGSGVTVFEKGHGPGVVLVHGALGDCRQWEPISEHLAGRYRVLSVSRRHHWPSPPPPPDVTYSYESHCNDLLAYLRSLDDPVHLVGHSYGAGVVILAAMGEPKRVRSLAVIEPAFGSVVTETASEFALEVASRNAMVAEVRALVSAGRDERGAETLIDWVQGGTGGFGRLSAAVREGLLLNARTVGPTFATAAPTVTCDLLQQLRMPTLVMNGADTRLWYRRVGEAVAACIPGAETAVIPAAGHMAIVENPEETAALLLAFLTRH
jgi:pimeloyl-ACP methyl ester carboxylesterase